MTFKGQSLLELVVGISLIAAILTALVITTTQSLINTQFSRSQSQATKLAQENLEKVRTIKIASYGVCLSGEDPLVDCSTWEEIWLTTFGNYPACATPPLSPPGCTFKFLDVLDGGCKVIDNQGIEKQMPICLSYSDNAVLLGATGSVFTGQVIIEDEADAATTQKRVTSRVFWTSPTGQHSSDLVTVFSKL